MAQSAKTLIRALAKEAGYAWLRAKRTVTPREGRVLLMPPAATGGSLGDEAMICAVASSFEGKADLLLPDGATRWDYVPGIENQIGGFDVLNPLSTRELFRLYAVMNRYDAFYCLGADVMDGHYYVWQSVRILSLLRVAARLGLEARLLGFSWSGGARPEILAEFSKLPRNAKVFLRDPVSYGRFCEEVGVEAASVADVAFLLKPDSQSPRINPLLAWVRRERAMGQAVLGVNIAAHAFGLDSEESVARVGAAFAEALDTVRHAMPELAVVVMPHDRRDVPGRGSDIKVARDLASRLAPAFGEHITLLDVENISAPEMKAVAAELDLVLTSRMHLAIAALGSEVPVACMPYLGKFEGLLEHFRLEGITIEPERAVNPAELSAFLLSVLPRREALRRQVAERLPHVQRLALMNIGD